MVGERLLLRARKPVAEALRSGLSRSGRHCAGRTDQGSTSVNPSKNRVMSVRLREISGVFQCRSWVMRNSPSAASGWASPVMWVRAR